MVRLKERKLAWALRQTDKKNREVAYICGIGVRRFQQLKAYYRRTGQIPMLNPNRRPPRPLTEEEKRLIDNTVVESRVTSAVTLRLHIIKYYGKTLPRNKIHAYLLRKGVAQEDEKKKRQRHYRSYQRKHTFSLGHMDWHESRVHPGKQVTVWEDDASRLILAGGEFDRATEEGAEKVVREAQRVAYEHYSALLSELNTDQGTQFYGNARNRKGERVPSHFEKFLEKQGIHHIRSRRNHPQTNGKEERWFRTYEEKRHLFRSFEEFVAWYNTRIHLGLSRTEGITPQEAALTRLRPECLLGLFFRSLKQ